MKNTWLSFLIVLSIALQSCVAMANSDENHQVDYQHLQTEHSHDIDKPAFSTDASNDNHNSKDCHHCGHCQGSHTQWLTSKKNDLTPTNFQVTNLYLYSILIEKSFIEELIRPPIS